MAETTNRLVALSDHAAQLVERTGSSVVDVHGGGRRSSSGIHWRPGVIVTAEEVLEWDEGIKITLPRGRLVDASLAGRNPSTDVAVLRFQPDGLPAASTADAAQLRPGHVASLQSEIRKAAASWPAFRWASRRRWFPRDAGAECVHGHSGCMCLLISAHSGAKDQHNANPFLCPYAVDPFLQYRDRESLAVARRDGFLFMA